MSKRKSLPACIRADARFAWDSLERNALVYLTVCEMMSECREPPSYEVLSYEFKTDWSQAAAWWNRLDETSQRLLKQWNAETLPHGDTFGRYDQ